MALGLQSVLPARCLTARTAW
eukprot:jgi/Chlat1/1864/Chrsp141S02195